MTSTADQVPGYARERVRHAHLKQAIARDRILGFGHSDDEICRDHGYDGADEFWRIELSEPMALASLIHILDVVQADPAERLGEFDKRSKIHQHLDSAFNLAIKARPAWLKQSGTGWLVVRPFEAVRWLLSMPQRRALVPESLRVCALRNRRSSDKAKPLLPRPRVGEQAIKQWLRGWLPTTHEPTQKAVWDAARIKFGTDVRRMDVLAAFRQARPALSKRGPRARKSLTVQ